MSNLISPDFNKPRLDMDWVHNYPHLYTSDVNSDTIQFTPEGEVYYGLWFRRFGLAWPVTSLSAYKDGLGTLNELIFLQKSKGRSLTQVIADLPDTDKEIWTQLMDGNMDNFAELLSARAADITANRPSNVKPLHKKRGS